MSEYKINSIQVSELLNVKPNTPRVWRCKNGRAMPDKLLELLKLKLEKKNV